MKHLRQYIKRLLKESLEEENLFDSMFLSGDWDQINQAIILVDDMGMNILDLPWDILSKSSSSLVLDLIKDEEMSLQLAKLVIDKAASGELSSPDGSFRMNIHNLEIFYDRVINKDEHQYNRAKRKLGPTALKILQSLRYNR